MDLDRRRGEAVLPQGEEAAVKADRDQEITIGTGTADQPNR
ncbi:hypothetical protein [Rhizobium leguminosarum]|nr:hypothetical protein [Rhizobium leguminosarum]